MAEYRPDPGHTPNLDELASADQFLDALAAGESPAGGDPGEEALAGLLAGWRDESRRPPAGELVSEDEAVAALRKGKPARARRGLAMLGSVAATVLVVGGFGGAVVVNAHPGDALYGLRTTLLGERPAERDTRIVLTAKTELDTIQTMINQGQWDQAQQRLTALHDTVQTVGDADKKQDLADQVDRLNVQVQQRDPNATPPPAATSQVPAATTSSTTAPSTSSGTPSVTP